MSDRTPLSESLDAIVDLASSPQIGPFAYVIAKRTFSIRGGALIPDRVMPLFHDLRDPSIEPRIRAGSDFWIYKEETDLAIQGSAHCMGRTMTERTVGVRVGDLRKKVRVFGRRMIEWRAHGPTIMDPEPFEEVPLTWENAYGGLDWRVPVENAHTAEVQMELKHDHPGMYPRNPFGKGYLVLEDEVPEMEMPQLEDPDHLLGEGRLITKDPSRWFEQPLPWCFDWMPPACFPRVSYFCEGAEPWFPAPTDRELEEVRRGFLDQDYRSMMSARSLALGPHPRFYQEASHGMSTRIHGGEDVVIQGMHPEEEVLRFRMPSKLPRITIQIDGKGRAVKPRIHSVLMRPGDEQVDVVYGATLALPRIFLPGIHKHIPVAATIDEVGPVTYVAPPTLREQYATCEMESGT